MQTDARRLSRSGLSRSGADAARVIGADVAAVAVFVAIGRNSHDKGVTLAGVLSTAWPFVTGTLAAHAALRLTGRHRAGPGEPAGRREVIGRAVAGPRAGAVVIGLTVIIGMVLRHGVQGEGTPFSFIVVATVFLTALMIGWRLVVRAWVKRRHPSTSGRGVAQSSH